MTTNREELSHLAHLDPDGKLLHGEVVLAIAVLLLCGHLCLAHAQKRVEAGLLLDYLGVSQTQTNNFGVGGRLGYRVHHNVMVEGELAYDYGVNFQEAYSNIADGNVTAIEQTSIGFTQVCLDRSPASPWSSSSIL